MKTNRNSKYDSHGIGKVGHRIRRGSMEKGTAAMINAAVAIWEERVWGFHLPSMSMREVIAQDGARSQIG